ncbi:putative pentatricopeptide repeat-containing protein At1g16830 [Ananas comosus]|uniref:Pentatricopeptide repeat-containing protein At1g16830 n=2 Tax=Ananas comosus TaxID=4615 RepID=A0A6P5GGE9_ANACO|nr:putative pentatricopeptide repeat-containing protein At1g16830 [Ananas comosus]XP_020107722.1 putative pentatricopeptide repeat-containing protein At1g16830 [Ananas comosus]XP_020107723.1 putative pentatricopeptide repeat-containing protein At1g16830 [Ananas comosus]XP_020107725.1 putative pentatricopeptide repeat-containing protein At1g16830 [Ananas comosus]XP_020107726.1 putative pentatricopeptide repeat-containing protein At1g16830 [Ananas comosus]XP_020107727.1 putative pentatricopeptid
MIWRRPVTLSWHRTLKTLANPVAKSLEKSRLSLSPQIVDSTLSNCPSDTIALSFFLWCARQPDYFHDPRSFDRIVPVVRRLTDRFGSVPGIIEELESVGCPVKAQTFIILLRVYWRGNLYSSALEVFDEMGKWNFAPNTFARNIILDVLFRIGDIDAALKFLRGTQSPNFLTYNIVLSNLSKSGDWVGVWEVFKAIVKSGFRPNAGTFTVVFDCCRKLGRFRELLQLLSFMLVSGMQLTLAIWTMLIDSLCQVGQVDSAIRLLEKMVKSGFSPNVVTYTSLVKGLFRAQKHDKIVGLLDSMSSDDCNPDVVLYNVMMDCFSKERRYDDAIDVFFCLRDRNLKPDAYTISTLMSILRLSRKISLLPQLVPRVDVSFDLVLCNSVLSLLSKAGFPSQAVEFYGDIVDRGFKPDCYSYVGLLNSLCQIGRIDYAINVYLGILMNNPNVDPYVHTAILVGLIKNGKYYEAIRLFRRAVSENCLLDVVAFTNAIHGLFRASMYKEACDLFDQLKEFGVSPNTCTYNVMLRGFCKARDLNAVQLLLRDMELAEVEMDSISFNTIVVLLIKLNRFRSASRLVRKMLDLGMQPNSATCSLLSRHRSRISVKQNGDFCQQFLYYLEGNNAIETSDSDSSDALVVCSGK